MTPDIFTDTDGKTYAVRTLDELRRDVRSFLQLKEHMRRHVDLLLERGSSLAELEAAVNPAVAILVPGLPLARIALLDIETKAALVTSWCGRLWGTALSA